MLAHSPPFPLVINHNHANRDPTPEDEQGIMRALQHRSRVRRIRLRMSIPSLQKLVMALDCEFPMLEYLYIVPPIKGNTCLTLPPALEAPRLRRLWLAHFVSPIASPLVATAVSLATLSLQWIHPSTYPHPTNILQPLSLLPRLETLRIGFRCPVPKRDIERQLLRMPIIPHIILPNLRLFHFEGVSAYLEELLPHMTTPLLGTLRVHFFNQLSISVPRLPQFMMTTENITFSSVTCVFHDRAVSVFVYPRVGSMLANFYIEVTCGHIDWQVSSVAQIFNVLSPLFTSVVDLTLDYREHTSSSEWHNEVDRARWRELLGSFRNVKTLHVHDGLVGEVSRSLRLDGEVPLELLPELNELICPQGSRDDRTFAAFIHEREAAGQPVKLVEKAFPVGRTDYRFDTSAGVVRVNADQTAARCQTMRATRPTNTASPGA